MSRLFIPVVLGDKKYILSRDVYGCDKVQLSTEDMLIDAVDYWNNTIREEFRGLYDWKVTLGSLLPAVQDGDNIYIYSSYLKLNANIPSYMLNMLTGELSWRKENGEFFLMASPLCAAWNAQYDVSFRFDECNQLIAVVNGVEMSLEDFEVSVCISDRYFEKVQDFLK